MIRVVVKPPAGCSVGELADFQNMLLLRQDINRGNIDRRLARAVLLALYYEDSDLLGITALKRPSKRYITSLEDLLGKPLPLRREIGWAYTRPECRGQGVSGLLLMGILDKDRRPGMFAVTRTDNPTAGGVLEKQGFYPYGGCISCRGFESVVYCLP